MINTAPKTTAAAKMPRGAPHLRKAVAQNGARQCSIVTAPTRLLAGSNRLLQSRRDVLTLFGELRFANGLLKLSNDDLRESIEREMGRLRGEPES